MAPTKVGTFHTILHPPYQAPARPRPTISGPDLPYQAPCILSWVSSNSLIFGFCFLKVIAGFSQNRLSFLTDNWDNDRQLRSDRLLVPILSNRSVFTSRQIIMSDAIYPNHPLVCSVKAANENVKNFIINWENIVPKCMILTI